MSHSQSKNNSTPFDTLPILHLPSPNNNHHNDDTITQEEEQFCNELRHTCHTIGFFYITNHDISSSTCTNMLQSAKSFFSLSEHQKAEIEYTSSPAFRGYMKLGVENTNGLMDYREQIEFGVDRTASVETQQSSPHYNRLIGPNQYPNETLLPEFKPNVKEFMNGMEGLSRRIMQYLALSLNLDRHYFASTFDPHPNVQMKIVRYPPHSFSNPHHHDESKQQPSSLQMGVGEHTDSGYLSLLYQQPQPLDHSGDGGLQVQRLSDQTWIDAPPIPNTIVVNMGEMLQLVTNGYYLATPHRVLQNKTYERLSVPYFWNPRLDFVSTNKMAALEHPKTLIWEREPTIKQLGESSDSRGKHNKMLQVYGENAFKSLARSHPDVMARHHSDLIVLEDGRVMSRCDHHHGDDKS